MAGVPIHKRISEKEMFAEVSEHMSDKEMIDRLTEVYETDVNAFSKKELREKGLKVVDNNVQIIFCWLCISSGKYKCINCKERRYCSQECQKQDWSRHKLECSDFKKNGSKNIAISREESDRRLLTDPKWKAFYYRAETSEAADILCLELAVRKMNGGRFDHFPPHLRRSAQIKIEMMGETVNITIPTNIKSLDDWLVMCYPDEQDSAEPPMTENTNKE